MAAYSRVDRANEILQLAFRSGCFDKALTGAPRRNIEAVMKAEAAGALGPEFADMELELTSFEPYVVAKTAAVGSSVLELQVW